MGANLGEATVYDADHAHMTMTADGCVDCHKGAAITSALTNRTSGGTP
jgi:hypothetical protein